LRAGPLSVVRELAFFVEVEDEARLGRVVGELRLELPVERVLPVGFSFLAIGFLVESCDGFCLESGLGYARPPSTPAPLDIGV
jgi:hypothetical protein